MQHQKGTPPPLEGQAAEALSLGQPSHHVAVEGNLPLSPSLEGIDPPANIAWCQRKGGAFIPAGAAPSHTKSSYYQPPPHTATFTLALQSLGGASSKGNDAVAPSPPEPGLGFSPEYNNRVVWEERSFNEPPGRESTPARRRHRRGCHHRARVSSGPLHPTAATTTSPKTPKRLEPAGGRTEELGGTFFSSDLEQMSRASTPHQRPPPHRRPGGQGDGQQALMTATHRKVDAASTNQGRRPRLHGPCQGRAWQHLATGHPHKTPARPRWRGGREGARPPSSFQRRRLAPHPTTYLHAAARGALSADPRRPRHRRCGLGRRMPQGTVRGSERRGRRWRREI
jgi:hypothetical protein